MTATNEVEMLFSAFQAWIEFVMTMTERVLAFAFILVMRDAFVYHRKFLNDVTFDNAFVTIYFRHIDARWFLMANLTAVVIVARGF